MVSFRIALYRILVSHTVPSSTLFYSLTTVSLLLSSLLLRLFSFLSIISYATPPVSSLTLPYTSCLISPLPPCSSHILSFLTVPYPLLSIISYATPPVSSLTCPHAPCSEHKPIISRLVTHHVRHCVTYGRVEKTVCTYAKYLFWRKRGKKGEWGKWIRAIKRNEKKNMYEKEKETKL
jgi:hypothetical protein